MKIRLTSAQFERLLKRCQWTHAQAAHWLDVTPRQIRRYACGETPVPHVVALALHYLRDQHDAGALN